MAKMSVLNKSLLLAGVLTAASCASDPEDTGEVTGIGFKLGPVQTCAETTRLGFARFTSVAASIGLDQAINPDLSSTPGVLHTPFLAEDLDGDGDVDLSFNHPFSMPAVYENDGSGHFSEVPQSDYANMLPQGRVFITHAAADMNGDALPDLVFTGSGLVAVAPNLGDLHFGEPEHWIFYDEMPYSTFQSFHLGDVDADNDLDILLAGTAMLNGDHVEGEEGEAGPELLFLNSGSGFDLEATLVPDGGAGFSLISLISDYDNDGDQDLQTFTDLGRRTPSGFYRNDGLDANGSLILEEEGAAKNANLHLSAMGSTTGDYNRDGRLDYCMSDIGPAKCLISAADGSFVESGVDMGLEAGLMTDWEAWSGWSMEIEDLDNDGFEDAVGAAGLDMRAILPPEQPDAIWQGVAAGLFEDRSIEVGFGDTDSHYAMATADLNGDGFMEIITLGAESAPVVWKNQCDNQSWLKVELEGPHLNRGGFGVRVEVVAGGQRQIREIQNLRALAQAPSRAHFGLGETQLIEEVTLTWPDGNVDILRDFAPNRVLHFRAEDRP